MKQNDLPTESGLSEKQILEEKQELESRALEEQRTQGTVNVRCPKCRNHPTVKIIGKNINHPDRINIRCACGYLSRYEIYF